MPRISLPAFVRQLSRAAFALAVSGTIALADDLAPKADERQLAHAPQAVGVPIAWVDSGSGLGFNSVPPFSLS
jgi:hypothetical protein